MKFAFLAFVLLGALSNSWAKNIPNSTESFLKNCAKSADCELQLFTEISKTYRPPKEEDELRAYILKINEVASAKIWNQKLETFQDPIGNVMIRLPATGSFAKDPAAAPFALQSHMDMVLAYAEAKPGEDLRPYFKDGIQMETKDGWLQSKDNKTTLGSDNGIGVAIALRYLLDPTIAHPPLELIFTVQEEIGLIGAIQSQLPIQSKRMLCLDGMTPEEGYIIAGAQGSVAKIFRFETKKNQTTNSDDILLNVKVTKLAGGHSGGDIHRNRNNAIKMFGNLTKFISSKIGPVRLKTFIAGDMNVLNKIPNLFMAELVLPKKKVSPDLKFQIETYLKTMIQKNEDDAKDAVVEVTVTEGALQKTLVTSEQFAKSLTEIILTAPNGVIDKDTKFFNDVYTSNNLSFSNLEVSDGSIQGSFAFMARGFSTERIQKISDKITLSLQKSKDLNVLKTEDGMHFVPWMESDKSNLLKKVLTESGVFTKKFYLNGGLEPSAFKQKFKDLEVVALGPYTLYAHSVKEQLKLASVQPVVDGVKKIVQQKY